MKDTNKEMVFNNETVDMKALAELLEMINDTRVRENDLYEEFEKTFLELNKDIEDEQGNKS
jgi:hypothetical protein